MKYINNKYVQITILSTVFLLLFSFNVAGVVILFFKDIDDTLTGDLLGLNLTFMLSLAPVVYIFLMASICALLKSV
ncbi:hypothetical protein DW209_07505 [Enterobacter hormaechei]|jgi:hypothetical protein|uniref:hypothetical protein n=1 Tax=Enterobacteriaceae TaxID=543 RepID=UPI00079AA175|nr:MULTISPECIES: hypothetical protein [Enterobacteriaceae]EBU9957945.1 hypothetical protein [Salmonella enterica subsp. enterica serovar Onireke]EDW4629003.1 hypothetical protein [Salmonella enterica subsp. enterica]ELS2007848.1 hypothetical protein [Salmonella enterica]HEC8685275.1 hypothetical protein [Salmonella enterica subsp. enterica serovar Oranienburg]AUZ72438.1 hypothetical protein C2U41_25705 [Citrobacter freundii complex sp. CFNIH4]